MTRRITPVAALLLVIPPLMWPGNAVVGRLIAPLISPVTLNLLRWTFALLLLLPPSDWWMPGWKPSFWSARNYRATRFAVASCRHVAIVSCWRILARCHVKLSTNRLPVAA